MRRTLMLGFTVMLVACLDAPEPPATGESAQELTRDQALVSTRDCWWVSAVGGDRGVTWRQAGYDREAAGGWTFECAPFGYGESYLAETIPFGSDPNNKPPTVYALNEFTVDDPAELQGLRIEAMYDDGFVAYINGVEVARRAMPSGAVTYNTLAFGHEATNGEFERIDIAAHLGLIVAGQNTFQVEIHQQSRSSSDLVMAVGLIAQVQDPPPPPAEAYIPRHSEWRFWDGGGDLGSAWRQPGFDVSEWKRGRGALGYGETYIRTTVSYGPSESNKHITTYFRRDLIVHDPSMIKGIIGRLQYDDGVVVYLNGTRIMTAAMPSGTITASTLSLGHEATMFQYDSFDWSAHRGLLRAGVNTVAIEVHQQSASSSDLVFDAEVVLVVGGTPTSSGGGTQVPRRSIWTYWDRGGDLGTAWRNVAYDTSTWASGSGPLGYGESYIATTVGYGSSSTNKHPTTYFRKRVPVSLAGGATVTGLTAEVMYDDGVVIYLNGQEVRRLSMPTGTVTWTTRSTGHEANNAYVSVDLGAFKHLIVDGDNVIAVEVHQVDASSSDLVFDMSLDVRTSGGGGQSTPVFTPYAGNPIISPSGWDSEVFWRAATVGQPHVLRVGGQWVMFYIGSDGGGPHDAVGRAVSSDGISWTLDDDPIAFGPLADVVHDGTHYIKYMGSHWDDQLTVSRSVDGLTWTGHTVVDTTDNWDATVLWDGDGFEMWNLGPVGLVYATSSDGFQWNMHGVVTGIEDGRAMDVIKEDGVYKAWDSDFSDENIVYYTSPDGRTWSRHGISLATGPEGTWSDDSVYAPSVVRDGTRLRMWYTGGGTGDGSHIGTATE